MRQTEEWRAIPGYDGVYEISKFGEIRSWRKPGKNELRENPVTMKMSVYFRENTIPSVTVRLTDLEGRSKTFSVRSLMRDAWMQGRIEGKCVKTVNGDTMNLSLSNLHYVEQDQWKGKGGSPRKPVQKIDKNTNEVLELYPSRMEAAKKNHLSRGGLRYRIENKIIVDGIQFVEDL